MQINPTINDYPVFELSEVDLPDIIIDNKLAYEENLLSSVSNKRKEITDIPENFLERWHQHGATLEKFITDPQLQINTPEIGAMWFGKNQKFKWNNEYPPRILLDSAGFYMEPHLDNRDVFAVVIVNLQDNPEGTGTKMLNPFGITKRKQDEVVYQGPIKKGTGILMFNNWNTWHSIENYSQENRLIAYYTIGIDSLIR
jgi:hypothetical protein|tara:strand:- start:52 stop:648 length:597 start_codon:yes stop_codon:yes gene_type:complete